MDTLLPFNRTGGRPAIFLDKDGTLINDVPYNVDPGKMTFAPGAVAGLTALRNLDALFIVVSNQSGVALGKFAESDLAAVHRRLKGMFRACGVVLTDFYWCPHAPTDVAQGRGSPCECRKPAPGMLLRAAREHGIDLNASWMIGDILDDVEAGQRAGCRAVLIDNGNETMWQPGPFRKPVARCTHVGQAIAYAAKHIRLRSGIMRSGQEISAAPAVPDVPVALAKGELYG